MKRIINVFGISFLVAMAMLFAKPVDAQPGIGVSISFQTFYDELSPYGDWIDYPEYGYTWRPRVGSDFRPYATNGNWVYTDDYDWMWNSGYDWGWAPFHYGRWFYDPYYGWLWVPGYDWSPAWVSWRGGGDYYGWAPIRPGISISIGFGSYNPPYDYWTFAPCRYMTSPYIGRYYYPYRNNITIFNRTTIINNYGGRGGGERYYRNGPRRGDVERYTGRINAVSVRSMNRPGRTSVSRNAISVYRPSVARNSSRDNSPRNVQRYTGSARGNTNAASSRSNNSNGRFNSAPRRQDAVNNNSNIRQSQSRGQVQQRSSQNTGRTDQARQMQQRSSQAQQQQYRIQRSQEARNNERVQQIQQQRQQQVQQREAQVQQQRAAQVQQQRQVQAERSASAQRSVQTRSANSSGETSSSRSSRGR
ncbi:MAG: hypothetical protein QM640_08600 [Niabella sp.]